ncbi:MAG: hypothetical protein BJ554DRAFT_8155 [Olpidium bornovanus]|uniref:Uncharacterized protein n=1 Tax=Olpidium bornovanus TaxID=278681 RepID=A0A8H7ZUX2_9FUNG|nr:MAG: hypothetical protein BJ554DRAFT_8155 [Olpidium bornovanus]
MLQRSAEREDMDAARDTERVITVASAAASATPSELSGPTPGSCGLPASAETLTEPSSAVGPAKGAIGDEPQAALPPPPHKAGLEAADDAESSPDAMWRRLMNECRIDRERLEVLCCLSEAVPEEVVSRRSCT